MKATLLLASNLVLWTLLPAAAQSLPTVTAKDIDPQGKAAVQRQTADRRAAAYKGPKVVKDTKKLGEKIIRDSKPDNQSVKTKVR